MKLPYSLKFNVLKFVLQNLLMKIHCSCTIQYNVIYTCTLCTYVYSTAQRKVNVLLVRLTFGSPVVYLSYARGSLLVCLRFAPSMLEVHSWYTRISPEVCSKFACGSLLVHPRFTHGLLVVHSRFASVSLVVHFLYGMIIYYVKLFFDWYFRLVTNN